MPSPSSSTIGILSWGGVDLGVVTIGLEDRDLRARNIRLAGGSAVVGDLVEEEGVFTASRQLVVELLNKVFVGGDEVMGEVRGMGARVMGLGENPDPLFRVVLEEEV